MGPAAMDAIILNERDNVATALRPLAKGAVARIGGVGSTATLGLLEDIPLLHKVALVTEGDLVYKYGEVIGVVTHQVAAGNLVHVHNMKSRRAQRPQNAARRPEANAVTDGAGLDHPAAIVGQARRPAM
jgi:altronate dehydratase small subunit